MTFLTVKVHLILFCYAIYTIAVSKGCDSTRMCLNTEELISLSRSVEVYMYAVHIHGRKKQTEYNSRNQAKRAMFWSS